ncbi:EamA family transporter [Coraliomargarita sinensis]|uniref:EamA family transporter n=1 Tax=Coraliomargarita sinensis TaxID=2174842 RepID=A0A317ZH19_9BACT|nr:EamA family transporter [Coraliomargarita sinensis]PXA04740.1 EamA family transporter [Coraliomargarita sinensis]
MLYLFITTLIWAFSFGLIGQVLQGIDPMMIAGARLATALLVFLPLLRPKQVSVAEQLHLAAIGAVQFGTMYICYLSAFRFIPSHLVALFSVLTPIYVVLIHDISQKELHFRYLLAAMLSVAGASVIKAQGGESGSIWIGFALMQVSGVSFAFGQVAYRDWRLGRTEAKDHEVFGFLYAGGAAVALLASFLITPEPGKFLEASGVQFGVILYLGAIASGLGFFLWNKGATLCSAGALAAFNNALIPLAMFVSLFVFGEISGASASDLVRLLVGAALITAAVFIGKRKSA